MLTFTDDEAELQSAADALALAVKEGFLGRLAVERADGHEVFDTPLARMLSEAGFSLSPRGLRLRA
jgi:ATP-dependent Lhr-like helicase